MVALRKANETRYARADLKAEVTPLGRFDGQEKVAEILADPPAYLGTLAVFDLLTWIYGVRTFQAHRIVRGSGLRFSESRTVGELTERERGVLARYLRGESTGAWAA
jgi:hypothetical protein